MLAKKWNRDKFLREIPLHIMMLPGIIIILIYHYRPMVGILMAFEKYNITKGIFHSPWVGLRNFDFIIHMPDTFQVLWNTVFIALMKIAAGLVVPVTLALLLNEIKNKLYKRSVQTILYLPHFLSWVILSGILLEILSPSSGVVNNIIKSLGFKPIFFLGNAKIFPFILVATHTLKEMGFSTILYLAALTSIDVTLYEAAIIDGANRWRQTWHITLPGIKPIIVLLTILAMGNILNAGFEQVFNLYNPMVMKTGDILDTLVYRMGIVDAQYSFSTAISLFKSVVSLIFIAVSYKIADKVAGYRVF